MPVQCIGWNLKWVAGNIDTNGSWSILSGKNEICRKFSSWGAMVAVLFSFLQLFQFPQLIYLLFVLSLCYSQDYSTYYILTPNYWSLRVEHILLSLEYLCLSLDRPDPMSVVFSKDTFGILDGNLLYCKRLLCTLQVVYYSQSLHSKCLLSPDTSCISEISWCISVFLLSYIDLGW